jgi:hypothetical protein
VVLVVEQVVLVVEQVVLVVEQVVVEADPSQIDNFVVEEQQTMELVVEQVLVVGG